MIPNALLEDMLRDQVRVLEKKCAYLEVENERLRIALKVFFDMTGHSKPESQP